MVSDIKDKLFKTKVHLCNIGTILKVTCTVWIHLYLTYFAEYLLTQAPGMEQDVGRCGP